MRSDTIISLVQGFRGDGVGGRIFNFFGLIVDELQLLGSYPWQMIPFFVIVGMEEGYGTTGPTYAHHNQQNKKSVNANSCVGRNLELCLGHLRPLLHVGISEVMQDYPTYPHLHVDGVVVQSTAAVSPTIKHPPLINHFHRRDVILVRANSKRKQTE